MPSRNTLFVTSICILFAVASYPAPAFSAEESAQRPFYIDLIKTEARLFGISIARFTPTQNKELLQQYLANNLKKNASKFGAFIEVFEIYRKERLTGKPVERVDQLLSWLGKIGPGKELTQELLDLSKLYLLVRKCSLSRAPLKTDDELVKAINEQAKKIKETYEKNAWGVFLQAIATQSLRLRAVRETSATPPLALLAKSSLLATQDGQLHYVLGSLYLEILDSSDVATFVKLVTAEFEKCLLLQPSNRELFTRVTGIYVDIHERYQAKDTVEPFWFEELVYKRIIALDPTNAQAHNNLSFLYSTLGVNLKQALREARIANQLKPDNPYLQDTLGWAYYRNGMLQDALKVLKKAVAAKPDLADVHFHLASVYYDLDEFEPTVRHFREAIRLDPKNAFARNNLAYFFAEKNRNIDEALRLVDEALLLSPSNAPFLDTKGWVLYRLGKYDEALPYIRKALALSPETSELHLHLGQVLLAKRQFKDAIRAFEHALAYDPDNKDIARRLSRLFALHSLQTTLRTYSRISGVKANKENFKIFYDLMARIHMEDNNYEQATALLKEYHALRPGDAPPHADVARKPVSKIKQLETTKPVKATTGEHRPTVTARIWRRLARFHRPENDFLIGVTSQAMLKLLDIALKHYQTPVPPTLIRGLVGSRLPSRVVVGMTAEKPMASSKFLLALQFPPQSMRLLRQRLTGLSGTEMDVPASAMKVKFAQQQYKGLYMGHISLPFGGMHYLFPADDLMLLASDQTGLINIADKIAEKHTFTGPAFFESADWKGFENTVKEETDFFTFLLAPHGKRLASFNLEEKYKELIEKMSSIGTTYQILPGDLLEEETMIVPFPGAKVSEVHQSLSVVLEELKSKMAVTSGAKVSTESEFKEQNEILVGVITIKGLQTWLVSLLSSMTGLDIPVGTPPAPANE